MDGYLACPLCQKFSTLSKKAMHKHVIHCQSGTIGKPHKERSHRGLPGKEDPPRNAAPSSPQPPLPARSLPPHVPVAATVPLPSRVPYVSAVAPQAPPTVDEPMAIDRQVGHGHPPGDSFLSRYDLRIEPHLQIVYCLQCEEAVMPSSIRGHVLTHLPSCPPLDQFTAILKAKGLNGKVAIPSSRIAPVPGLKLVTGLKCRDCGHLGLSLKSMRSHHQTNHPGHPHPAPQDATVHKIYEFRGDTVLVEVDTTLVTATHGSAYQSYRTRVPPPTQAQNKIFRAPQDPKDLDGFLYATKWHESITDCHVPSLRALVAYPTGDGLDDKELSILAPTVERYISTVLDHIVTVPVLVLRWINTPNGRVMPSIPS
jgi:Orsellinic acid/F9775 biosynthesis cluster protein D